MVRYGTPPPKVATVDDFKQALLNAESVVYNQASTGIYLENLFDAPGNRGTLENQDRALPGCRSRARTHWQRQRRRNRPRCHHRHHRGRKQRTAVRRAVTARNSKLHDLRRRRPNRRVRSGSGAESSSASSLDPWPKKHLHQQASNKRRKHSDVFPKEISLHLVSARCVASLRARLEISPPSLIGRKNGKGLCKKRKRKAT